MPTTEESIAPFELGKAHIPSYYKKIRELDAIEDWADIAFCWDLQPALAMALKYLLRAGRKPGASAEKDLTKVLEMVQRELQYIRERDNGNF